MAIESGLYDTVLVAGAEKMTSVSTNAATEALAAAADDEFESGMGLTFPGVFGIAAVAHMQEYGTTEEDMGLVAVKAHKNASTNPLAQFQKEITLEKALTPRYIAWPLKLFDCSPISDGAAVVLLASSEFAKKHGDSPIHVVGSSSATDYISFHSREDRTGFIASRIAMKNALKKANFTIRDIQISEVYDQSTLLEMVALEDLGFSKKGKAWLDIYDSCEDYKGFYKINGRKLFVNTNGGLKADGNPLGATGGAQLFEVVKQLRGEAGDRQIKSDEEITRGCILELEGFGSKAYVHVLRRS